MADVVDVSVFRGVPVDRYSRKETIIAYWGFGLYWGKAVSQNKKGHLIGHIKVGSHAACPEKAVEAQLLADLRVIVGALSCSEL